MNEILRQIGQLLLSSIPAIIGFLIVWAAYRAIVYKPMQRVLAERQARTEGAIQQAQAEISSAEERTAEYERRVREARAQIFATQEARSRRTMEQRDAALAEARGQADSLVKSQRASLEEDVLAAKASLQQQAETLAQKIIESVLKPAPALGGR
jgi:F-type H+-transporting ATPase subunit b